MCKRIVSIIIMVITVVCTFVSVHGNSTSALIRQADRFLQQSNFYLNISRGISSIIGSGVSF